MAEAIRMPLLSDTMKEGVIAAWHKKVGDKVKGDDVIADVETDKATMEVMPYVDGVLLYIGVETGKAAKVNGIIAIIGKEGEDFKSLLDAEVPSEAPTTAPEEVKEAPAAAAVETVVEETHSDDRVKASPLAKKIAQEKGINLVSVAGSGDGGRIIKRDIDNYTPSATKQTVFNEASGVEGFVDQPLSQMRKIIAQRLSDSMFTAPHFYLKMTVNMDNAMDARKAMIEATGTKISFNDIIIKAVAASLRKHPAVNSSWMGDFIRQNKHIHIGTAVAIEDGLIVPVIKFADQKTITQIADEAKSLAEKARTKKLQPPEFTGNTFTISNLGMMDIDEFTAIINPPDACILAVGKIAATPVVKDGQIVVSNLLKLTLSCDHRVVDGSVGAQFLKTLKFYLENPVAMFI